MRVIGCLDGELMRLVHASFAALLAGCSGTVTEEAPPTPEPAPAEASTLAECRETNCGGVADVGQCIEELCQPRVPVIKAGVKTIRFDEHTVFVELSPTYTPGGHGSIDAPRDQPIFVGVTAVTPSGQEIDLLVQEIIPGSVQSQIVFTAELDDHVDHVLVGLWDRKITPCDSERNGCKEFGFLLDGSLATYPPHVYETGHRQRLLQEDLTLRISAARSLTPSRVSDLTQALEAVAAPVIGVYGVSLNTVESPSMDRAGIEVRYRHPRDIYLAGALADYLQEETGIEPLLRYIPEGALQDIEVTLGTDTAAAPE